MAMIGDRIKQSRKEKGLTQEKLARLVGVTKSAVSQWENNQVTSIEGANLYKLAEVLCENPFWLLHGKGRGTPNDMELTYPTSINENNIPLLRYAEKTENAEVKRFVDAFNQLDSPARQQLAAYMDGLLAGQNSRDELNANTPHRLPEKTKPKQQKEPAEK